MCRWLFRVEKGAGSGSWRVLGLILSGFNTAVVHVVSAPWSSLFGIWCWEGCVSLDGETKKQKMRWRWRIDKCKASPPAIPPCRSESCRSVLSGSKGTRWDREKSGTVRQQLRPEGFNLWQSKGCTRQQRVTGLCRWTGETTIDHLLLENNADSVIGYFQKEVIWCKLLILMWGL